MKDMTFCKRAISSDNKDSNDAEVDVSSNGVTGGGGTLDDVGVTNDTEDDDDDEDDGVQF